VHADNYEKFLQGYTRIATAARLSPELQGDELMTAVRSWLEDQQTWLLVLDNADDLRHFGLNRGVKGADKIQNLSSFVPRGSHGSILWTTRDERAVGHVVGMGRGINVGCMTGPEAEKLLADLSGCDITSENSSVVAAVLERLDRLPLAVSEAAFYMRETTTPFEEYLMKLRNEKRRWRLLAAAGPSRHRQEDVPNSVMHTWRITMDYLSHVNPLAHRILRVIAYFNHQSIPLPIIKAAGKTRTAGGTLTSIEDGKEDESDECQNSEEDSEDEDDRILVAVTRLAQFSFLQSPGWPGRIA
jgi:hypothetical protein